MSKTWRVALTAPFIGILCTASAQGPRRDGLWEIKTEMQMEGMPMTMWPMTSQQCITPAEANDPNKSTPQSRGRGAMTMKYTGKRLGGCTK